MYSYAPGLQARDVAYMKIRSMGVTKTAKVHPKRNIPCKFTDEEIKLIAWITNAEAEGESELGQRLVIDTILNRVDSNKFPNTVKEVIFQENQFSCIPNGRANRVSHTDRLCELVKEEIASRKDADVVYFGANGYSAYGTPLYIEGNHYFSAH